MKHPSPVYSANAGILTVVQRPADYRERRDDGYKVTRSAAERVSACYATQGLSKAPVLIIAICQLTTHPAHHPMNARCVQEPECIFIVGTAHFSEQSAEDVARVIEVGSHQSTFAQLNIDRLTSLCVHFPEW